MQANNCAEEELEYWRKYFANKVNDPSIAETYARETNGLHMGKPFKTWYALYRIKMEQQKAYDLVVEVIKFKNEQNRPKGQLKGFANMLNTGSSVEDARKVILRHQDFRENNKTNKGDRKRYAKMIKNGYSKEEALTEYSRRRVSMKIKVLANRLQKRTGAELSYACQMLRAIEGLDGGLDESILDFCSNVETLQDSVEDHKQLEKQMLTASNCIILQAAIDKVRDVISNSDQKEINQFDRIMEVIKVLLRRAELMGVKVEKNSLSKGTGASTSKQPNK